MPVYHETVDTGNIQICTFHIQIHYPIKVCALQSTPNKSLLKYECSIFNTLSSIEFLSKTRKSWCINFPRFLPLFIQSKVQIPFGRRNDDEDIFSLFSQVEASKKG